MCGFSLPDLCHVFPADINPTIAFLSNSFVQTTSCIAYILIAHTFQFDIEKIKKFPQSNSLLALFVTLKMETLVGQVIRLKFIH